MNRDEMEALNPTAELQQWHLVTAKKKKKKGRSLHLVKF